MSSRALWIAAATALVGAVAYKLVDLAVDRWLAAPTPERSTTRPSS